MGVWTRDEPKTAVTVAAATQPAPKRLNRAPQAPYNAQRGLTASAEQIKLDGKPKDNTSYQEWQREAWVGYEEVGEIHYGFNLLANLLSRVRIYPGMLGEINETPVDVTIAAKSDRLDEKAALAAKALVDDLLAYDGSGLIRTFSLNMSVPGECYLVKMPMKDDKNVTREVWTCKSTEEVRVTGTTVQITSMRGGSVDNTTLDKNSFIGRMWRPNPRYSKEPDSSMVGVRTPVNALLMIERLIRGAIRSRLNAGMLFVPDTITGSLSSTTTSEPIIEETTSSIEELQAASTEDPGGKFLAELIESMSAPIADESSAASVVPMLVTGPSDDGEKIKHITFERASDEWLAKRAEWYLERVLNGIDIPKEIVTGLQAVKYSNAVVIDENLYKSNIEPLALALADALTDVYFRPYLRGLGIPEETIAKLVIWYDPSEIVTRPNSADDATEGVDRGLISGAAWRREHGFAETDAATPEDMANLAFSKMTVLPEVVVEALVMKVLGEVLPNLQEMIEQAREAKQQPQQAPVEQSHGQVVPITKGQARPPTPDPQQVAVQQVGR